MNESGSTPPTVLLVEDDEAHVELIRLAFVSQTKPFQLVDAASLREARAQLASGAPDLLIADYLLPDGNGTELIPKAESSPPYPVLVMTSFGNEQVAVEAMKMGALDYVVKSEHVFADMPHIAERALRQWREMVERKEIEQKLRRREEELAHAARLTSMGTMVAEVTHELGQPLFSIVNFAKACLLQLERLQFDEKEKLTEWISRIHDIASHGGEVLSRLRTFVRPSSGGATTFDLNELIAESILLVQFDSKRLKIRTLVETQPAPILVRADYVLIQQVLVNLLKNAFEALGELQDRERRVTVRAENINGRVRVTVEDNGEGLREDSEKLFDAFVTSKPHGMGLGLAISRNIVETHGGSLEAVSRPGKGAAFSFTLASG